MTITAQPVVTGDDLPAVLRAWRSIARKSLKDVAREANQLMAPFDMAVSHELLRRWEDGDFRGEPDPGVLASLAKV